MKKMIEKEKRKKKERKKREGKEEIPRSGRGGTTVSRGAFFLLFSCSGVTAPVIILTRRGFDSESS